MDWPLCTCVPRVCVGQRGAKVLQGVSGGLPAVNSWSRPVVGNQTRWKRETCRRCCLGESHPIYGSGDSVHPSNSATKLMGSESGEEVSAAGHPSQDPLERIHI